MKVLELFSGSQSVGKVCKELGYKVVSVDITNYGGTLSPTHLIDIMKFDYKQYDHFDIIWASPPCINYSTLQFSWYGRKRKDGNIFTKKTHETNMKESDKIVAKTIEIIDHFNPDLWIIENPQTGLLKSRAIMINKPFYDVTYCKYSDWGYRKATRIWTNLKGFKPKFCKQNCDSTKDGKHINEVSKLKGTIGISSYLDSCRVPPKLIKEIFDKKKA